MARDQLRVVVIDDHELFRGGLVALLEERGIKVIGEAGLAADGIRQACELNPDVVLMDLNMPVMNGVQATRLIRSQYQGIHVLVLATYDFDVWISDALRLGAEGFLLKDSPRETLAAGIQAVAAGKNSVNITPNINAG